MLGRGIACGALAGQCKRAHRYSAIVLNSPASAEFLLAAVPVCRRRPNSSSVAVPFFRQEYICKCNNALCVTVCMHALHRVQSIECDFPGAQQPQRLCALCLASPSMSLLLRPPPACPAWLHPPVAGSRQSQHLLAPCLPGQRVYWSRLFSSTVHCVGPSHLKR